MRTFLESLTGEQVTNPDLEHGSLSLYKNPITFEFNETQPEEFHYETIETYESGGEDVEKVVTQEQEGDWEVFDYRGGTKRDITDIQEWDFSKYDNDRNTIHHDTEDVQIYHVFNEEEQEEHDAEVALIEEMQEKQEFQNYLYQNEGAIKLLLSDLESLTSLGTWSASVDTALTELYEAIETQSVNIQTWNAVAHAYVRRIKREEITINNVPESIREKVQKIIDEENN